MTCQDKIGIIAGFSKILSDNQCFIIESAQYGDLETGKFFMRTVFESREENIDKDYLLDKFSGFIADYAMDFTIKDFDYRPRTLILVSKYEHCLRDLLHRANKSILDIDVQAIISNHQNAQKLANFYNIDFQYLPILQKTPEAKLQQEAAILKLVADLDIDLVILARYMQILSPDFVKKLESKIINIHHSFLPSFKGAKPYHQAHKRGVKLIGATAHFVTDKLDEGPIIEQEVNRIEHTATIQDMVNIGYGIESEVLIKAVKYISENRVFINGDKTVIFK
ncbi:MAG: formyltetrahydrofolate deformylase [Pseudomonadota bacterium]